MKVVKPTLAAAFAALALAAAGCASTTCTGSACADSAAPVAADEAQSAAAFEKFRALAGSWKGTLGEGEAKGPAKVVYRVTAGGSAVEETLFCGSPHEMVTMYHRDGPRLMLTHYCAAGNQPTMVLLPGGDAAEMKFGFVKASNMASPDDGHMHEAVFDLSNPERVRSVWTFFEKGAPGMKAVIQLERDTGAK